MRWRVCQFLCCFGWLCLPPAESHAVGPVLAVPAITLDGQSAPSPSSAVAGFALVARDSGPQVALLGRTGFVACMSQGEDVSVAIPISGTTNRLDIVAEVTLLEGEAEVALDNGPGIASAQALRPGTVTLHTSGANLPPGQPLRLSTRARSAEAAVRWRNIRFYLPGKIASDVPAAEFQWPAPAKEDSGPPPVLPALRRPIEEALIEWDWRMQDGIGSERQPSTYGDAIERTLKRGDGLLSDLRATGMPMEREARQWEAWWREWRELNATPPAESVSGPAARELSWEDLWLRIHRARRQVALHNPLMPTGPLLFVKQVPSCFSHQLTQYQGSCAKPGGGIFVLDVPGKSMRCRPLASGLLPLGSCQHPDVSFDGQRVLFSFCHVETSPKNRETHLDHFYHLYEMRADGSGLRQLTDGPYDDLSPRTLPDGNIMFISTRRGGFHRCGQGPCATHTLALANADGSNPHPVSFHETHEWDAAVLNDGRVIYTRWDYVDRHAVHYQQLWTTRPDGTGTRAFYGNYTLNPVGVWEARPVPGSSRVMATAAAHHAMTAGSIILLDTDKRTEGLEPITRLTPDALFPESETPVSNGQGGAWHAPVGVEAPLPMPPEALRWPGHCYRTPQPLSEKYFLAAYSFDPLIGEPSANPPNTFGLYLVDCFGNKELLYRDLNISSLWPTPLRSRPTPPVVSSVLAHSDQGKPAASENDVPPTAPTGTFFLQDVHASWPPLPSVAIRRLRIVQVLPKSTPHANQPFVGAAFASPGKQVLGTVPVEPDGSAYFTAPAGIPLAFQALDEHGQAVQVMRSITYLQPGETVSCVGCHEPRGATPGLHTRPQALQRAPSTIDPGPDGSNPLSYPILVQPVLDRLCVSCHSAAKPKGGVALTGEPQGHYTTSYHAIVSRVRYSAWDTSNDFRKNNCEPLTQPGFFGARGSPLMKLLLAGHEKVQLTAEDRERLVTWMDANALFYGTFDSAAQARQQRGERIAGPNLQ